ncbi:MAG: hypothetical protein Q8M15_07365 [Bacteroidota bacterium]|nr:hypothetical protein [Bacteroidota bacterium]
MTRNGRKDVANDNPSGKEDFDSLLEKMVNPPKSDNPGLKL